MKNSKNAVATRCVFPDIKTQSNVCYYRSYLCITFKRVVSLAWHQRMEGKWKGKEHVDRQRYIDIATLNF